MDKYDRIAELAATDVEILRQKNKEYGESWKRRGGVGAFMMLARKWDRIEEQARQNGYDIFRALHTPSGESLQDTIMDLRAYLFLVEEEYLTQIGSEGNVFGDNKNKKSPPRGTLEEAEPRPNGYVNQD